MASMSMDRKTLAGAFLSFLLGAALVYTFSALEPRKRHPIEVQGTLLAAPISKTPTMASPQKEEKNPFPDYLPVGFEVLSAYYYEIPDERIAKPARKTLLEPSGSQIPVPIRAFNQTRIVTKGFVIPIKLHRGSTREFLLVRDHSLCCFGRLPRMNEWISVKMPENKSVPRFDLQTPLTVMGTLEVGEEYQDGDILSIYRMKADAVALPFDY